METTAAMESIVRASQAGDREAFTRLVESYKNVVASIVMAIVRDVEQSEDIAQEVFLAAWAGVAKLREPSSFLPWLRQLARNNANSALRVEIRNRNRRVGGADGQMESIPDLSPDAASVLVSAEERKVLFAALDDLSADAREIVTLYYREGRSVRQVADLLDLREATIKKRLERARAVLRQGMLDRFADFAERTAPKAAFTTAVTVALAVSAPTTAAAATSNALVAAGSKVGTKVVLAGSGLALGLLGGLGGVFLGYRRQVQKAADNQERRELKRLAYASGALILAIAVGIQVSVMMHSAVLLAAVWLVAMPCHAYLYLIRLPRIIGRRDLAERTADPAAASQQRRERYIGCVGFGCGVVCGSAAVVYAVVVLSGVK